MTSGTGLRCKLITYRLIRVIGWSNFVTVTAGSILDDFVKFTPVKPNAFARRTNVNQNPEPFHFSHGRPADRALEHFLSPPMRC